MKFNELKNLMDRFTSEWIVPGNSISVYHKNEEVFRYTSGYSDLEKKIPMKENMSFNIYSTSKVSTVVGALQLFEKGYYLLSDPLYEYIPQYREMFVKCPDGELRKAKNPITIGNLFTMTAGFGYSLETDGIKKARELTDGKVNTVTLAECMADDPLSFEPGEQWQYSWCHDVLGAFIEIVSGKRFSEYMIENVFKPCGIKDIAYHLTPELEKNMAKQYMYKLNKDIDATAAQRGETTGMRGEVVNHGIGNNLVLGEEHESGGGGIITTVEEYAKFCNMLANGGKSKLGEQVISKGTINLLRTNQLTGSQFDNFNWPQLIGYGYGLGVRTLMDRAKSGCIGTLGGFGWGGAAGANVLIDPENEFSFFYAQHLRNAQEGYYQPRLINAAYMGLFE